MIPRATYWAQALEAAEFLDRAGLGKVDAVLQCGSGMAELAQKLMPQARSVEQLAIPFFPPAAVAGHGHEAVGGSVGDIRLLVFAGRAHLYEGLAAHEVGFPAAVAAALGARLFIAANAAGGLSDGLHAGSLLLHDSFINLQGDNPLLHISTDDLSERFIDPNPAFDPLLTEALAGALTQSGAAVQRGVYVGVRGPAYETAAELQMLKLLGADAVGMSCLPEVLLCHFFGLPVVGLSIIANECFAGERHGHGAKLCHTDVLRGVEVTLPLLATGLREYFASGQVVARLHSEV